MKYIKRFTALFFEYLYRFIQFLLSPIVIYIALICIQAIYLVYDDMDLLYNVIA